MLAGTGFAAVSGQIGSNVLNRAVPNQVAAFSPIDLRCENRTTPMGIDSLAPRLSWKLKTIGDARNQSQAAYQIRVSSSSELLESNVGNLWDSGKVPSDAQLHVEYQGIPLQSGSRCYWKVDVWDSEDRKSTSSDISWWEMGLLSPSDWQGQWIDDGQALPESDEALYENDPSPLFRRSFELSKPVKRARLYATALGYYDLKVNGKSPSDIVLDPPWTSTDKRVYYTTYDVTDGLRVGENVLGVMLGNGWHNPLPLRMWSRINLREHLPVGRPRFLSELVVEFEDGTSQRISTDDSWRVASGPLLKNSVYLGEVYDARLERTGWASSGFDDSDWSAASVLELDDSSGRLIQASPMPPIRVTRTVSAVSVEEVKPGVFVFDLGQNFAGWARLNVSGPRGTEVTMRMGELVYEDGTLNPMTAVAGQIKGLKQDGTPRGGPGAPEVAWQVNTYTLRGDRTEEVYTPRFTFHGFRYVEVTGFPGKPAIRAIEGLRLNTDVESVGTFRCSNARFNQIQELVKWTFLSNIFSVQSDCPAREKYQYGGDIVASSEMAIFNYDMSAFYSKSVEDFKDAARDGWFTETAPYVGISAENYAEGAGPIGWGLAHPLLIVQLVQYYGDTRLAENHFEAAKTWVDLLEANSDNFIIDRCIGDHESLDPKPIELIATAQFYQAATMVADLATLLGKTSEARHYRQLGNSIRAAFSGRFVETGTGRIGIATQAAQSAALYSGLVPDSERELAVRRMVDAVMQDHKGHIAAGIFGTKYLLNMLSKTGHADVAHKMVSQQEYPGWIHMIENGATTLWETWAQSDNVYSQNHPMFGSVSEWFFKVLGGIEPDPEAIGFDRFVIAPYPPEDLDWVDASYASVRGPISCSWRKAEGNLNVHISIPVNTTALVKIPTSNPDSVVEAGRPLAQLAALRGPVTVNEMGVELELGSGRYEFTAALS